MIRQSLFTAMALLLLLLAETAAAAGQGPRSSGRVDATGKQQILVLDSFQYGLPVPDAVNRGIIAALTEGGFSISNICVQHLDFDRFPGAGHRADVVRLLRHKIIGRHPGAVIIMGALAVDFVAKECKELFSDETFITVTTPDITPLTGGIAHDLNNILFPICCLSELLLDAKPSSNPEYGSIEQIHKSAKRGSELVKQILAFDA